MRLKILVFVVVTFTFMMVLTGDTRQSAEQIYQSALYQEEMKGDLQKAIGLYESVIKNFSKNRSVVAKALLRTGLCYEKLGMKGAQKAYKRVINEYPEQIQLVKVAREKLSLLMRTQVVSKKDNKEFKIRKVWVGRDAGPLGTVSPDGRYLSFVDWNTGDLAIREIKTGKKRCITNKGSWAKSSKFALFSRWSPDSKQLVYDWCGEGFKELRIIGLDGPKPRIIYPSKNEGEWTKPCGWSPDGKHILASLQKKDALPQIILISIADGSVFILKKLGQYQLGSIFFSPDGSFIVYDTPPNEGTPNHDIFLLSINGKRKISLIDHPAHDYVLGWTPDGKQILFASDRTGTPGLWIIQVAEGKPQSAPKLVKSNIGSITPMGLTHKGSLYYGHRGRMYDVYTTEIDPDTGNILAPPKKAIKRYEGTNDDPDYSPDGKYLAYVSTRRRLNRDRGAVICIRSLETGEEREFSPKLIRMFGPHWSPDGGSILFKGYDNKNHGGIYRIDVQTGNIMPVVTNEYSSSIPIIGSYQWSVDGKSVFYSFLDRKNKLCKIIVRDLKTGTEKELYRTTESLSLSLSISPNGKWLALLNRQRKRILKIIPAAGGESRELYRFEQDGGRPCSITWTVDGRNILLARKRPGRIDTGLQKWDLWQISVKGGEPQKLGLTMIGLWSLSAHPDGKHIVFSSYGSTSKNPEIWVMENFLPKVKKSN